MAKAKKTPSGKWQIRVGAGASGKSKSFTADSKKEVEILAAEYLAGLNRPADAKTIEESVSDYIESKANILSPSTLAGYRKLLKNNIHSIGHIRVCDLTQVKLQQWVNELSANHAPKTVKNAFALLSAALDLPSQGRTFKVSLPAKQRKMKTYPTAQEVFNAVKGTTIELPVLLGMWEGMRMSEIRGAKRSKIKDGILTIDTVIVTADCQHIEKDRTKTFESARQLRLPRYILSLIDALPPEQDYLTTRTGQSIYMSLQYYLKKANLPQISFHDLRHINAASMLALGVPDKYAMERGGWSNPEIMRNTYQYTFSDTRKQFDELIDGYFEKTFFQTDCIENCTKDANPA